MNRLNLESELITLFFSPLETVQLNFNPAASIVETRIQIILFCYVYIFSWGKKFKKFCFYFFNPIQYRILLQNVVFICKNEATYKQISHQF